MIDVVHVPPNEAPIDEILAVMTVDEGGHGICASILPGLGSTPLVSGSQKLVVLDAFKAQARQIANLTGKTVGVFRFVRGDTVWLCDPSGFDVDGGSPDVRTLATRLVDRDREGARKLAVALFAELGADQ